MFYHNLQKSELIALEPLKYISFLPERIVKIKILKLLQNGGFL